MDDQTDTSHIIVEFERQLLEARQEIARLKEHLSSSDKTTYDELRRLREKEANTAYLNVGLREEIAGLKLKLAQRNDELRDDPQSIPITSQCGWMVSGELNRTAGIYDNAMAYAEEEVTRTGKEVSVYRLFPFKSVKREFVWIDQEHK